MIAALASILFLRQQEPPRSRMPQPNGSILLVEPAPQDKSLNIVLIASSQGVHESKPGLRHLLEHLVVEGQDGKLEAGLEARGHFLRAATTRDTLEISISCDPAHFTEGFDALIDILKPRTWSKERIASELAVIAQEAALQEDSSRLAAGVWSLAYPDAPNPIGDLAALATATPADLEAVRRQTFDPARVLLFVEGPIDRHEAGALGRELLATLGPKSTAEKPRREPKAAKGRIEVEGFGEARATVTPGIAEPETAANLAAAFAIASEVPESFVTYTPSAQAAVVTVGNATRRNAVGRLIDALELSGMDALFVRGRALAFRWLRRQTESPEADARLRGILYAESESARPESLEANLIKLTLPQFEAAMGRFHRDKALVSVGGGQ